MAGFTILRQGADGEPVRDLQHRLIGAGFAVPPPELGTFGAATAEAVRAFQDQRAIRVDGIVGPETWAALVESGFALGDRLLYHRAPNLRGDDVAELQRTLNRLGFDAGREDGILGPDTATALREFQRNAGVSVDGIAGPATLDALRRVEGMAAGSVRSVREREELRRPAPLGGRRIYLAVAFGYDHIGTPLRASLERARAQVIHDVSAADDPDLARRANRWGADLFVALRPGDRPGWHCSYFASGSFRSERGHHAAELIGAELDALLPSDDPDRVHGAAYTVLRETRMAAVVCALGDSGTESVALLLTHAGDVGAAIGRAIRRAFEESPTGEPTDAPAGD